VSTSKDIVAVLLKSDFFNRLDENEIYEIIDICELKQYQEGEILFRESDPGDKIYIMIEGNVQVSMASLDGLVQLESFRTGDFFGEISLFDDLGRTGTAKVVDRSLILEIDQKSLFTFIISHPYFALDLLKLLSRRLRKTNSLFLEMRPLHLGLVGKQEQSISSPFDVTLVGYGRYGNLHIGPKYAKKGYLWNVKAIVDPLIKKAKYLHTPLGISQPDTLLLSNFENWNEKYFQVLPNEKKLQQVIEVSLRPDVVLKAVMPYIEAGVKNIILPKPVVTKADELKRLIDAAKKHRVKVAISSQWYYSNFPHMIEREIRRLVGVKNIRDAQLYRVEIDFSKENGVSISTTPPLSEMPHVLQLLESVGLVNLDQCEPMVTGTETMVEVLYSPKNVTNGVFLKSNLEWVPNPELKQKYPNWDVQLRTFKVYLTETSQNPEIEIDFWIKFDRSGEFAIRSGKYTLRDHQELIHKQFDLNFVDDQLLKMNCSIYDAFQLDFDVFQQNKNILTLERYQTIGYQLMEIENKWQKIQIKS
jgi:hypothetical protein